MSDWRSHARQRLGDDAPSAIVEELAAHVEDVYRTALGAGRSDAEAVREADQELDRTAALDRLLAAPAGGGDRGRRRAWSWSGIGGDLRQALRVLRTRPAVSAVAIATLAIGIGASTAVFSVFNAVVLQPLPYPQADRLVLAWESDGTNPNASPSPYIVARPNYDDWVARAKGFEAMGIWEYLSFNLSGTAEPVQADGIRASSSLFRVLGVAAARGRVFTPEEDAPGHQVAVLSDRCWRDVFAADPGIIGRTVRVNDAPYEVIGVMPPGFGFPSQRTAIWIPMGRAPADHFRDSHSFFVAARLAPGVGFSQAQQEMNAIGAELAKAYPRENHGASATVTPMSAFGVSMIDSLLTMLLGAVGLVLLIACVNVANLQLGVGLARRREFVVRAALGAGFGRMARQLAVESLTLASLGGAAGVAVAWLATHATTWVFTPSLLALPFRPPVDPAVDSRTLAVATALSLFAALTFGLAPLVALRRAAPQAYLRDGERGATRASMGVRRVFIAIEVALAVVLLSSAGLLVASLTRVLRVDPGLDPRDVTVVAVSLPQADPYGPAERDSFCGALTSAVTEVHVFASVGATSHLPLGGANASRSFDIDGRPSAASGTASSANYRVTCPGYFATLAIPLAAGRDFTDRDRRGTLPVVILNEATADTYWPNHDALGQRIRIGDYLPWMTIVGVAKNVRHFALEDVPHREIYVPYGQASWPEMTVVARTRAPLSAADGRALREAVRTLDPNVPVSPPRTMASVVEGSVSWREPFVRLLTGFATIGIVLAAIGIYGVLAFYVSQRTREIGIRAALGATRPALTRLMIRQSLGPTVAGLLAGMAGSVWAGRLLGAALYGVQPGDPGLSVVVATVFVLVCLAASWAPAHRAATIDPAVALRDE